MCGTKMDDGALFCQKCGTKLIVDSVSQQADAPAHGNSAQQQSNTVLVNVPNKKKSRNILMIGGVIAAFLFIVIIISKGRDNAKSTDSADQLRTSANEAKENSFEYPDYTAVAEADNDFDDYGDEIFGFEDEDEIFGFEDEDEAEAYAYTSALDQALFGRWRSYNGGVIELSDTGYAQTSLNLTPWWAIGKSTSLSWEASNGQLMLITSYAAQFEYQYYPKDWQNEYYADHLRVGSLTLHRVNGNTGDSMIGVWDDNDIGGPYFTFNADGTGAFANDKYTTWEADDENVYIYYDLYTTYDYSVSGDLLTIFFSDGSEVYTRVGY